MTIHKHRGLLPFLGMASGASVATIYYNQPLLLEMSHTFHASSRQVGAVAVATQVGYAAGILLFVPMGDVAERRSLIVKLFAAVTLALLAAAVAPSLWALVAASVAIGVTASVTHVLVPMAAELAEPGESGRAIGTVMTGLLLGILLGRAASGGVAALLGWRAVFLVAAGVTALFVPLLRWRLPKLPPVLAVSYREALAIAVETDGGAADPARGISGGLPGLWRPFPRSGRTWRFCWELRTTGWELGWRAALACWARLEPSPPPSPDGWPTAKARAWWWRLEWRWRALPTCCYGSTGYHLAGLIVGVIVLNIGQQAMQIGNQTRIFSLVEGARSRVNTIYMIIFFLGGAAGSAISTAAWAHWQWNGVCTMGLLMLGTAGIFHALGGRSERRRRSLPA